MNGDGGGCAAADFSRLAADGDYRGGFSRRCVYAGGDSRNFLLEPMDSQIGFGHICGYEGRFTVIVGRSIGISALGCSRRLGRGNNEGAFTVVNF